MPMLSTWNTYVKRSTVMRDGRGDAAGLVMMSTLVGALVLARSVEDSQLSTRIMDAVRESLKTGTQEMKRPVNITGLLVRLVDHYPVAILLQQRLADPLHLQQLIHRRKRAVAFAVSHDRLRLGSTNAEEVAAQGFSVGGVQIDLGRLQGIYDWGGDGAWRFGFDGRGCCCGGGDGKGGEEGEDQGCEVGVLHLTLHDMRKRKKQLFRSCFSNLGDVGSSSKMVELQGVKLRFEAALLVDPINDFAVR